MSLQANDSDDEVYADNLSNCSWNDDIEEVSDNEPSDDEEIPRPRTFHRRTIESDSDTETSSDEEVDEWSSFDNPPVLESFLGRRGLNSNVHCPQTVSDAIELFIGDDLFEYFVNESNRYYHQNSHNYKLYKKSGKWKNITLKEMKKFLGLIMLMGQVRKDIRDEYWSTEPTTETPYFAKTMSRDRFRQIWKAWHFSNNEDIIDSSDRLCKVKPIIDHFLPKFINIYKPHQELSLDEGMIPWRGRLFFRVYNASKIVKYGILVRILCESDTGYICNFEIYCAQGLKLLETVNKVVSPYTNLWHHLYMDNYYNSVENCEILLLNKIRVCGTIRKNRGLPKSLQMIKQKKGESIFKRKGDVLLQVWQSKKEVRMISTIHSAEMKESQNIDWKTRNKIIKPTSVIEYNKHMKGVDRADQYLSYYSILRKTTKWTKRVTMYLINCALFNSFVIFNSVHQPKMKYKKFLHEVALHWITDRIPSDDELDNPDPGQSTQPTKRTPKFDPPGRLSKDMKQHTLGKIVGKGKRKNPLRQCRVCAAHQKRSETCFICQFCCVPLHPGKCFERYHTVKHY